MTREEEKKARQERKILTLRKKPYLKDLEWDFNFISFLNINKKVDGK